MVETSINIMDGAIVGIMLLSCLVAFIRGFLKEILSLGAWIAAGIITLYCFPYVAEWLKGHMKQEVVAVGLAALGTYMVVLIGLSMINRVLVKYAKSGADVGMLDNFLGLLFGGLRGAFIVSLGFFIVMYLTEENYPDWVNAARTKPFAEAGAKLLARMAPNYVEDLSSFAKEKGESLGERMKTDPDAGQPGSEGYNSQMQNNLQRLLGGEKTPETIPDTPAPVRYQ